MSARIAAERDVLIVACAVSAGIHAALTPAHLAEGTAAGAGFGLAAVALGCLTVALTRHASAWALARATAVLGGLLASYGAAVTTGIPLVLPEPEPIDTLALVTKAVEVVGLLSAAHLLAHARSAVAAAAPLRPKGHPA